MGDSPAARRIKAAYLELLAENPSGRISVTELARRAKVNRVTFYRLYETQEAVLLDILDSFDRDNRLFMDRLDLEDPKTNGLVRDMLEHHRSNMPMLRTILQSDMAPVLERRIERGILEPQRLYEELHPEITHPSAMATTFYVAGISKVISEWIRGGCRESVDEMIDFLNHVSLFMGA